MSRRRRLIRGGGAQSLVLGGQLPSFVTFTRASSATYFDSSGDLQTASSNEARIDYLQDGSGLSGLRIEGARTNSLRTSDMTGAVSGTPGTLPDNWVVFATGGLSYTLTAGSTINNMDYLDIRISGTASPAGGFFLAFEATTQIAALTGEDWTASAKVAIIAGDTTNVNSIKFRQVERTSGGSLVNDNQSADFKSSLTSSLQDSSYSVTFSGGGTVARNQPGIILDFAAAAADITLRIAIPQVEEGEFATSFIPTTSAAATRAADVATIDISSASWFNASEGTIYIDSVYDGTIAAAAGRRLASFNNSTANELIGCGISSGGDLVGYVTDGGASQAEITGQASPAELTRYKTAFTYKANDFAISTNGGAVATDTSGTLPTVDTINIGSDYGNANQTFGIISNLRYYPVRLPNATLQGITT